MKIMVARDCNLLPKGEISCIFQAVLNACWLERNQTIVAREGTGLAGYGDVSSP